MRKKLRATPVAMIILKDINHLEHDASSQYRFNRFWAILWFVTMITIPGVPKLYAHSISALIITEISLWANFATHFGAMSAALAAINTTKSVTDDLSDVASDVQDIQENTEILASNIIDSSTVA